MIVGKRARFSHERIDDVAIVDGCLILADDARHRLNLMTMMSHRDLFGTDANFNALTDQTARHRIRVGPHMNGTAASDSHGLNDVVRVEPCVGKTMEMRDVILKLLSSIGIGSLHKFFDKCDVLFASRKVPAAAQHQRLLDAILDVSVR